MAAQGFALPFSMSLAAMVHNGTEAADGLGLILPASDGLFRTAWLDLGSSAGAARVQLDASGSPSGSIRMRVSAQRPDSVADACPIFPATWSNVFDASIGTPQSQGWLKSGASSSADTPVSGILQMTETAKFYYRTDLPTAPSDGVFLVHMRLKMNAGHVYAWDTVLQIPGTTGVNYFETEWFGSWPPWAYSIYSPVAFRGGVGRLTNILSSIATMDVVYVARTISGAMQYACMEIYHRFSGGRSIDNLDGYELLGRSSGLPNGSGNYLGFGDMLQAAGQDVGVTLIRVGTATDWATVTDGQSVLAAGRWAQFDGTLFGSGATLDRLAVQSDTATVTPATAVTAAVVSGDRITATATIAAAPLRHYWRLMQGATVIARRVTIDPCVEFDAQAAGSYTVEHRAVASSGNWSSVATSGSVTAPFVAPGVAVVISGDEVAPGGVIMAAATLVGGAGASLNGISWAGSVEPIVLGIPGPTPTVALTTDDATIAPGETTTESHVITGTVTVTRNAAPLAGSGSAVVSTGVNGPLIGTTAAAPTCAWLSASLRIYLGATQPTTYTLQRLAVSGGTVWATDTTQPAAGVKAVSAMTYSGAVVGVSYATDHGWTLLTDRTYYYRLLPTYSDGTIGQPSLPIVADDQAAYECVLLGKLDEQHAGKIIDVRLVQLVVKGGQEYTVGTYQGIVQSNGDWTVLGLPRDETWIITLPGRTKPVLRIGGSGGSADFSALAPP